MPRKPKPLPRVLLTGFEPFGGERVNPSLDVVAALDGETIAGHRVVGTLLPVAFAGALGALGAALERHAPVLALGLGQAGGRARVSFERVALNLIDARIPDSSGAQPVDVPVVAGAPDAYLSTLPCKAMLHALQEHGIPAELSLSAGTYVCNAVFFALRHLAATAHPGLRAGFVHLPYLPAQAASHAGAPSLALDTMRDGVALALEVALRTSLDRHDAAGTIC